MEVHELPIYILRNRTEATLKIIFVYILIQLLTLVGSQVAEFMVEILYGMDHTVNARNSLAPATV